MIQFLERLISGHYGLARTYWLFGVLVSIAVAVLSEILLPYVAEAIPIAFLFLWLVAGWVYEITWVVGLWRAAKAYEGFLLWPVLAVLHAVVTTGVSVFGTFVALAMY